MVAATIDIETTGLDELSEVAQVACIVTEGNIELAAFERKVQFNPLLADDIALNIFHYDQRIWAAEAIPPLQAVHDLSRFLQSYSTKHHISNKGWHSINIPTMGHNIATFDLPRLKDMAWEVDKIPLPIWPHPLDSYQLASWTFFLFADKLPKMPMNFKLETLAEWFGIVHPNPHDALADCRVNVPVTKALLGIWRRYMKGV